MLVDVMAESANEPGERQASQRKASRGWTLLLVLPYIGLCFPQFYVRLKPTLWGFPFFYWYQFVWVLLASALLGTYYLKTRVKS